MNKQKEALEAALFALRYEKNKDGYEEIAKIAIKAIEKALAEMYINSGTINYYYDN